ncbi:MULTISPECIES: erythromycin esterase family protein [unclassified Janthinobacterium]|uniref:erythromycin esterase family protein n=1 Tax=unclassified Janthinobacterium TaxID=2610881 RepID=UPI000348B936|nr:MULTISPECIES: erythromycin esterase family protein [unclassified Janthinobacterium]MEC5163233.1 erythromycin esterase-like protein [Janthinobacterium sp. CG_S6]
MSEPSIIQALRKEALPLAADFNAEPLLELIGDAGVVLLGEASHGTQDFYRWRSAISHQLIVEKGFDAIAVEADWPDALQASRYAQLASSERSADQALGGFQRFPQWMWRNVEVIEFLSWLRLHNAQVAAPECRIGWYGLDLYSLRKSAHAVIRYLDQSDPGAARRARERYNCFDHLAQDPQHYAAAARFGLRKSCQEEVLEQLLDMAEQAAGHLSQDDGSVPDTLFYALQNARVVKNAEYYYRAMFESRDQSWNVRDSHMADTLDALRAHLSRHKGSPAKIIVWAHNSHLGDARATEMGQRGQLNLGQLVRQQYGPDDCFLLGFTTHTGSVTAASDWDGHAELKSVLPSLPDSVERLLHDTGLHNFLLPLRGRKALATAGMRYLERAIGVIYRPDNERLSHYFHADLAQQFDAVIHIDHSSALRPLEFSPHWSAREEVPETYPFGV